MHKIPNQIWIWISLCTYNIFACLSVSVCVCVFVRLLHYPAASDFAKYKSDEGKKREREIARVRYKLIQLVHNLKVHCYSQSLRRLLLLSSYKHKLFPLIAWLKSSCVCVWVSWRKYYSQRDAWAVAIWHAPQKSIFSPTPSSPSSLPICRHHFIFLLFFSSIFVQQTTTVYWLSRFQLSSFVCGQRQYIYISEILCIFDLMNSTKSVRHECIWEKSVWFVHVNV